jgi:hypothetical protein
VLLHVRLPSRFLLELQNNSSPFHISRRQFHFILVKPIILVTLRVLYVTKLLIMPFPPRPVTSSFPGTYILFTTVQSHTLHVIPLL